jgi:mRNA-degrading endonuclease RelE of RelBE toxin-antitoxin system
LISRPEAGKIIPGSGGLRKLRWRGSGRGKRVGSRVSYYWFSEKKIILMLYIYTKNETDDLTIEQIQILKKIIDQAFK